MAYIFKKTEKLVVFFITVTLISLAVMTLLIISRRNIFMAGKYYYAELKTARGIRASTAITLHDVPIGTVRGVALSTNDTIRLHIFIYKKYTDRIKTDSVLVLKTQIIGASELMLYPGSSSAPLLKEDEYIETSDTTLGSMYKRQYENKISGIANVDTAIANINAAMSSLNNPNQGLEPTLYELHSILKQINMSVTEGNIGYLLNNPDTKRILESSFSSIESIMSNAYITTIHLGRFSSMLNSKIPQIEKIINNTETLSVELVNTAKYMNIMMPHMISLTSNSAVIASNLTPWSKEISKSGSKIR